MCRSQWPRGLRRRSAAALLLRSWVRIPPVGMDVCLLWVLCVVRQRSLRRADHSPRGVLTTVVPRCVSSRKPCEWGGHDPRWVAAPQKKKKLKGIKLSPWVERQSSHWETNHAILLATDSLGCFKNHYTMTAFMSSNALNLWSFGNILMGAKHINPLKTKRRWLYLKTQSIPRCKHFSSRL